MKIFCTCEHCYQQIYLASEAKSRRQLSNSWGLVFGITCSACHQHNNVHVNNVRAETTHNLTPLPTTGGGILLGIIGGPFGMILGGIAGSVSGSIIRNNDIKSVSWFNNNYV